jgi:hypothetical protein
MEYIWLTFFSGTSSRQTQRRIMAMTNQNPLPLTHNNMWLATIGQLKTIRLVNYPTNKITKAHKNQNKHTVDQLASREHQKEPKSKRSRVQGGH